MGAQEQAEQAQQAEQAEAKPKAAAEAKPRPPPLAKPKPQPQPQAPHPPLPRPHPLAAKKSAKAAPGHAEVEEMRGELRGLSASLASQKGAKAKLESKVSQWETKLVELRGMGDEDRIAMAEHSLRKAKEKVEEKEEAIAALDRSVPRMETILAAEVDKVKEVEVEAGAMVEETVKEEVEAKVVKTAVGGGERVAGFFFGVEGCGGYPGPFMGPGRRDWPPPPKPGPPPPRRPDLDSQVFVAAGAPPAIGGGEVGMGRRHMYHRCLA